MRPSIPAWDPATETGCPKSVATLVRECWSEDATERPSFHSIVHKLEEDIEWIIKTRKRATKKMKVGSAVGGSKPQP